jgi:hypothetical protein
LRQSFPKTECARAMSAQFAQGELTADSKLTGVFARDETLAHPETVLLAVEDAGVARSPRPRIVLLRTGA